MRDGSSSENQFTLNWSFRPLWEPEDFVVRKTNRAAAEYVNLWPNWTQPSLILVGSEGSGKSHLASIWCKRTGARCIEAAQLRVDNLPGLLQGKYLAIEGVDTQSADDKALFHALNLVQEQRGNLLLTARTADVATWPRQLTDLVSRLRALPLVRLGNPDDSLLRAVLFKLFSDRQMRVDPSIIDYLVLRMERSFAFAGRLVERIDHIGLARGRPLSRKLVREVLASLQYESHDC